MLECFVALYFREAFAISLQLLHFTLLMNNQHKYLF